MSPVSDDASLRRANPSAKTSVVSIGLTVYNAAPFLRETLESLLAQDFANIELVISDNASTDGSSDVCREFAASDTRIIYSRNDKNIGAVRNWNRALELSSGEYFMWAADHDLWDPTYVSKAVSAIRSGERTVLAYPRVTLIDSRGEVIEQLPDRMDTRGMGMSARYREVLWNLKRCHMIHGVMVAKSLKRLGGFPNVWAMDMPLLGALSLIGEFHQIDEFLFFRRENREAARDSTSSETEMFHVDQLDPSQAEWRRGQSAAGLRIETRKAQLQLVGLSSASLLQKLHLKFITYVCYWSRYRMGVFGLERAGWLIPKRIRRSGWLRATQSDQPAGTPLA